MHALLELVMGQNLLQGLTIYNELTRLDSSAILPLRLQPTHL